jgi:SAM-dependent methyltransferase
VVAGNDSTERAFDPLTPSTARMYDYYLGGNHNFAADREAAEKVLATAPEIRLVAIENRAFLGRVVRFLAGAGIRQFIDIGTGLPTRGNVPEVAQAAAPGARVACVDHDPVVCAHARALVGDDGEVAVIEAAMEQPSVILGHPGLTGLIDFSEPVAVLFFSVLHFADDAASIVAAFRAAMAPGSYLALSHATSDSRPAEAQAVERIYRATTTNIHARTRSEVLALLPGGLEPVEPGLVWGPLWRPSPEADPASPGADPAGDPESANMYAVVARKP